MMSPKALKKDLPKLYEQIKKWIASGETYTIRFGVNMLMKYYLDEAFVPEYPELVASIDLEEYYVKMVVAWYFATALAKQYEAVLPYLTEHRLDVWTHNKTIQKAVESYRITAEQKTYLKTLKMK
jgi:alpha-D-ribose 1-methylphosphonate 5-phosphate C-P lyase